MNKRYGDPNEENKAACLRVLEGASRPEVSSQVEHPASFFQASICLRTIHELGALWHNVYWGHHQLMTASDALPEKEWTWYEPEPTDWRPQAKNIQAVW